MPAASLPMRRRRLRIESLAPGVIDTDMQGEIRCDHAGPVFTSRERFVALKQENQLADPQICAGRFIADLFG